MPLAELVIDWSLVVTIAIGVLVAWLVVALGTLAATNYRGRQP